AHLALLALPLRLLASAGRRGGSPNRRAAAFVRRAHAARPRRWGVAHERPGSYASAEVGLVAGSSCAPPAAGASATASALSAAAVGAAPSGAGAGAAPSGDAAAAVPSAA